MSNKGKALVATLFLLGTVFLDGAPARAISFSDEGLWRAAAGPFALENFDGFAHGTQLASLPGLGISFDFLNDGITRPTVQDRALGAGGVGKSGPNVLVNDSDQALPARGPIDIHPLNAGEAISALGYWNTGGDDTTILRFFDINDVLIESVTSPQLDPVFNGIVSAVPAFRAEIEGVEGNGYITLDDLQATITRLQVPEAASLALLGAALLVGLAGATWRRRR